MKNTDKILMIKKYCILFIFIFAGLLTASAQDSSGLEPSADSSLTGKSSLPAGFMNITLGMDLSSVKKELESNSWFDYRGDPDVSMLMNEQQQLIECIGYSFISKGYFQFYKDRLFIITLVLDMEKLDYYTMHTMLESKYGKAARIDPQGVYWDNSGVNFYLEKPLSLKYMDKKVLDEISAGRKEIEDKGKRIKEEFLQLF